MAARDGEIMERASSAQQQSNEAVGVHAVAVGDGPRRKRTKSGDRDIANAGEDEEVEDEAKLPDYKKRIIAMQKGSLWCLGLGFFFAVGSGGIPLFAFAQIPELFGAMFQLSAGDVRYDTLLWSSIMLGICGLSICTFTLDALFFGIAANRLTGKLRMHAMQAFLRQDMGFYDEDNNSASDLTIFLSEKVTLIENLTGGSMQSIIRLITCLCTMIVLVFVYGPWQLGLALFVALPIIVGVMTALMNVIVPDHVAKSKGKGDVGEKATSEKSASQLIDEIVLSIRTVASFNAEQRLLDRYVIGVNRIRDMEVKSAWQGALITGFSMSIMMYVFAGMYYFIGYLVSKGETDFKGGMTPLFLMMGSMMTVMTAVAGFKDGPTAQRAAKRFFDVTDRVSLIDPTVEGGLRPASVRGDIEVRDVVFAYPSAPEHIICKGYSLSIAAGQSVALCGASGSGKSTAIALIERFYDPQSGSVLLDGVDIKTLNVRWLRSQLGLVAQEPVLFMGTVAENIAYGKEGATKEEIEEAAKMANAHTFITESLGDGYNTDVGMRGGKLSGGQKQRVAIARAIVRKPSVLLLDEATSALDNESERIVQAALDEIMAKQKRTTVMIAHRLSTIRNADSIAVIHEGAVVERGTHEELLANPEGMYFKLVLSNQ